jgi:hypothetical protein
MRLQMFPTLNMLVLLLPVASAFTSPRLPARKPVSVSSDWKLFSEQDRDLMDPQADSGDEELYQEDPAQTTPQFFSALWQLIALGNQMVKGVS